MVLNKIVINNSQQIEPSDALDDNFISGSVVMEMLTPDVLITKKYKTDIFLGAYDDGQTVDYDNIVEVQN